MKKILNGFSGTVRLEANAFLLELLKAFNKVQPKGLKLKSLTFPNCCTLGTLATRRQQINTKDIICIIPRNLARLAFLTEKNVNYFYNRSKALIYKVKQNHVNQNKSVGLPLFLRVNFKNL